MKSQKLVVTVILLAGVALLIVGLTLQVPGTYLTTYASLDGAAIDGDTASSIREYVGGDAYNYIIGASLVGAKISGLITAKAVYTAVGVLVICLGLICLFCDPKEPRIKKSEKIVSAPEKADETTEEVSTEEAAQKAEETNASKEKISAGEQENNARSLDKGDEANFNVNDRLAEAVELVIADGKASISQLQRHMKIGYVKAGEIMEEMANRGIVSKSVGSKPREVLITREEFEKIKETLH